MGRFLLTIQKLPDFHRRSVSDERWIAFACHLFTKRDRIKIESEDKEAIWMIWIVQSSTATHVCSVDKKKTLF